MKHLKLFSNVSEYDAFKVSDDFVLPNVSYCKSEGLVLYHAVANDQSPYVMVDLGLPSGILWADRNVGAASPEDAGLYFQWGDTVGYTGEQIANGEKTFADWSDYWDTTDRGNTFNKYSEDKLMSLQPEDDAATVNMGSEYRMPTVNECNELINNCTTTYIDIDGNEVNSSNSNLKGIKLTGTNGNSIFMPLAFVNKSTIIYGDRSYFWTSKLIRDEWEPGFLANMLEIAYNRNGVIFDYRFNGACIRGVKSTK